MKGRGGVSGRRRWSEEDEIKTLDSSSSTIVGRGGENAQGWTKKLNDFSSWPFSLFWLRAYTYTKMRMMMIEWIPEQKEEKGKEKENSGRWSLYPPESGVRWCRVGCCIVFILFSGRLPTVCRCKFASTPASIVFLPLILIVPLALLVGNWINRWVKKRVSSEFVQWVIYAEMFQAAEK